MKTKPTSCKQCSKIFNSPVRELKRGNGKFCSLSCSAKYRTRNKPKPEPNVQCAFCQKPFYKSASTLKNSKSGLYFCCREHKDKAQRLGGIEEIMPDHYGASKYNYRNIAFKHFDKKCSKCNYNKYPEILIVHHKDRDRKNNEPSNLEILCPTCHFEHHFLTLTGPWTTSKLNRRSSLS